MKALSKKGIDLLCGDKKNTTNLVGRIVLIRGHAQGTMVGRKKNIPLCDSKHENNGGSSVLTRKRHGQ